jgi:hypothetical protein
MSSMLYITPTPTPTPTPTTTPTPTPSLLGRPAPHGCPWGCPVSAS